MMKIQHLIPATIILVTAFCSCKEKDVSYTTDIDEIKSLLTKSEAGIDLFRYDSLIIPTDYTHPADDGIYRDTVVSHRRDIQVTINPDRINYWYPRGLQTEAIARVIDEFTVLTTRTYPDTVIIDTTDRALTRFAFVLQLGNEGDAYKGWYLWGFNGGGSTSIDVYVDPAGGPGFPGDQDIYQQVPAANADFSGNSGYTFSGSTYIRLEDIRQITDGDQLAIATLSINAGTVNRPAPRLSAAGPDGFFSRNMFRIDRNNAVDTIATPSPNPRIWNLVYIETFHDTEFFFTGAHVFAYRVPLPAM